MRILMVSLTILLVSAAMACGTGTTEKAEEPADRSPEAGQGGLVENPGAIPSGARTSLIFQWDGEAIRDEETGSRWSVSGRAIDGPLAGAQLESPVSINHFWFSWNAFQKNAFQK
ncbi:MAG: DUF3179 domain-containing (seleno)protein [Desulfosalsimonadaceae bacterium]